MATFAIIHDDNTVATVVVGDSHEEVKAIFAGKKVVLYTEENPASHGWTYDESNNTFTPPAITE